MLARTGSKLLPKKSGFNLDKVQQTIHGYDQTASEFARKNYAIDLSEQRRRFLGLLDPQNAAQPLLDLGCGPGRDTLDFIAQGYNSVGIDLSAGMLTEARQRIPQGQFVQANMLNLPFAAETFGGVWACASLLHLPRPDAVPALVEMYRILKPGGSLFLGVQRGQGEACREKERAKEGDILRFFYTYYLPGEFWNLVADSGFEVEALAENFSDTNIRPDGSPVRWINLYARKPAA